MPTFFLLIDVFILIFPDRPLTAVIINCQYKTISARGIIMAMLFDSFNNTEKISFDNESRNTL